MSRRQARETAMQTLASLDILGKLTTATAEDAERIFSMAWGEQADYSPADTVYARELAEKTRANLAVIDELLAAASRGWKIKRMATADRNLVRLAVCEMEFVEEVSASVAISEAVELAKVYGTDDSPKFVNGILGAVSRRNRETPDKDGAAAEQKAK